MDKLEQATVVKKSLVEPARTLDPQFRVDEKGRIVSEQELLEQARRLKERAKVDRERSEKRARWESTNPEEILKLELERIRPGTLADSTFSIQVFEDGIDVHLFGRSFRILAHVLTFSAKTLTWDVTAKGALDRLKAQAVRPDAPKARNQAEVYQEQAAMLRELADVAGISEDPVLAATLEALKDVKEESVRWKTEVNTLFLHLRMKLQCLTSQPLPQLPQAPPEAPPSRRVPLKEDSSPQQPPRRRPQAVPPPPIPESTPEGPDVEASPTI